MSQVQAPYHLVRQVIPLVVIPAIPDVPDREQERLDHELQHRADCGLLDSDWSEELMTDVLNWEAAALAATGEKQTAKEVFAQIRELIDGFDTEQHTPVELDSLLTEIYQAAEYGEDAG
jgi:hypothetical protein